MTIAILPSLLMSLESKNVAHYIAQLWENDPRDIYQILKEAHMLKMFVLNL